MTDLGPDTDERVDYPDFAALVARDVAAGTAERGVLVCGTGIGMAVAADKVQGIRAANVVTPEFAALAREHNDANVIALSGRFVDEETNRRILDAFLSTDFERRAPRGPRREDRRPREGGALATLSRTHACVRACCTRFFIRLFKRSFFTAACGARRLC